MVSEMTRRDSPAMLGIYLNDHLAGATAGAELASRAAASRRATSYGAALRQLATDIAQDRAALLDVMRALGVPARAYKVSLAWLGEKAARLKLNGRLLTKSPLSLVEEIEMLRLGVEGKAAGWRTLRVLAGHDARLGEEGLDELLARANAQSVLLEGLRVQAAIEAFEQEVELAE